MSNSQKSVTVQNFVSHEQSFRAAFFLRKKKTWLNKDILKISLGLKWACC